MVWGRRNTEKSTPEALSHLQFGVPAADRLASGIEPARGLDKVKDPDQRSWAHGV